MAEYVAVPQIQRLLDVRQIIRPSQRTVCMGEPETDLAEVQPVRIVAQPFDFGRLVVAGHVAIRHEPPVQIGEFLELKGINAPAVRVRNRVPAPVGQCAERRCLRERFGKSLQARRVNGEGKFAVADGQRIAGIELMQRDIVPRHERMTVNRLVRRERRRGAQADEDDDEWIYESGKEAGHSSAILRVTCVRWQVEISPNLKWVKADSTKAVSYTHLRAHETRHD